MNCLVFAYRQNHYGNDLSLVTGTLPLFLILANNVKITPNHVHFYEDLWYLLKNTGKGDSHLFIAKLR